MAEHYLSLSVDELIEDVLRHYKMNVWPLIERIVTSHSTDALSDRVIVEGSALWPESVAGLSLGNIAAIWLTAGEDTFKRRIHEASDYPGRSARERVMVDQFLKRTVRYNEQMMDAVRRLGLASMSVEDAAGVDELAAKCLSVVGME